MMNELNFIVGLMALNREALGFIPSPSVESQYLTTGRYIIQSNTRGVPVGYVLHGALCAGRVLTIAQHVIEYDYRQHGHGMDAARSLIRRATNMNCRAIVLKCAEDLDSNYFWLAAGFEKTAVFSPQNTRQRKINVYTYDIWGTLWSNAP